MGTLTVRNLDESTKASLRLRAAQHGCSMAQEVRHILHQTLAAEPEDSLSFAERVNRRFKGLQVESLPIPARQAMLAR